MPLTPVPLNAPELPELGKAPVTAAGVAVKVRVSPWHMLAEEEVMLKLLFCCTVTVIEDEPPG